jgi:hypothetical protein
MEMRAQTDRKEDVAEGLATAAYNAVALSRPS